MTFNGHLPITNPATGEQLGSVAMSTPEEVERAVQEMRQNFEIWHRKTPQERANILRKFQKNLIDYADEITRVVNLDTGKSRQDALSELFLVVDKLQTYTRHTTEWLRPEKVPPGIYVFKKYYVEYRPYGVVAVIGPWNLPLDLTLPPMYAALLAGNTIVLKPSEVTPSVGVIIEKLVRSVPELSPFVRVLHGDGSVGANLVDAQPDLVFLTGSTNTGRKVAQATAESLTPFISELGGKDPMIVLEDANVQAAARWGVWGAFFHSGQTCVAVERVYVLEEVYDAFVEAVLHETRQLRQGYSPDELNPNDLGPLTFDRQVQIIEDHLQDARAKGACVLLGGGREGLFMEPTVITDVNHSMKLMHEETFGPIMPIMKVKNQEEAIQMANDSSYGLSASIWSDDLDRAKKVAEELEVGSVVVNDTIAHYAVSLLPFGGVKKSGTARTHGKQDLLQFTQTKAYGVGGAPVLLDVAAQLRQPNNYHLMNAIFHALFGVTPQQRLKAVRHVGAHLTRNLPEKVKKPQVVGAAAAGLALGTAAVAFGLRKDRQE